MTTAELAALLSGDRRARRTVFCAPGDEREVRTIVDREELLHLVRVIPTPRVREGSVLVLSGHHADLPRRDGRVPRTALA